VPRRKHVQAKPKPRRSAASKVEVDKWVDGGKSTKASPKASPKNGSRLRRDQRGERISVYLPEELERAFRIQCATEKCSFSIAMTEAATMWLKKRSAAIST